MTRQEENTERNSIIHLIENYMHSNIQEIIEIDKALNGQKMYSSFLSEEDRAELNEKRKLHKLKAQTYADLLSDLGWEYDKDITEREQRERKETK